MSNPSTPLEKHFQIIPRSEYKLVEPMKHYLIIKQELELPVHNTRNSLAKYHASVRSVAREKNVIRFKNIEKPKIPAQLAAQKLKKSIIASLDGKVHETQLNKDGLKKYLDEFLTSQLVQKFIRKAIESHAQNIRVSRERDIYIMSSNKFNHYVATKLCGELSELFLNCYLHLARSRGDERAGYFDYNQCASIFYDKLYPEVSKTLKSEFGLPAVSK